ncbi:RHS repeat-associated core domain-containing protein [uncultured Xanthomonas sp.]|uniref:RHS repeat-associated core domain-containing protein n=1 Tax=uncultured Xanthomonas sp. TaxID=152831 RepID=UPI0025D490F9|nr:RHS repeat-associated core domain-containing protein [uncultured Xanthomonas sp.]
MTWFNSAWKSVILGGLLGALASTAASQQLVWSTAAMPAVGIGAVPAVVGQWHATTLADGSELALAPDGRFLRHRVPGQRAREIALPSVRIDASVTLLPSGRVLVWGGRDAKGRLQDGGAWFDPASASMQPATGLSLRARYGHTATVLTDGRLLLAGGTGDGAGAGAQLWDEASDRAITLPADLPGGGNASSRLLADGRVALPASRNAQRIASDAVFDPLAGAFLPYPASIADTPGAPRLAGSVPVQGAAGVAPTARLALRFSRPLHMPTLSARTVTLVGPEGRVAVRIAPVEQGRLLFVQPRQALFPDSRYTLMVDGARGASGDAVPLIALDFRTAAYDSNGQPVAHATAAPAEAGAAPSVQMTGAGTSASCANDGVPCRAHGLLVDGVWYPGQDNTDSRWRIYGASQQPEHNARIARIAATFHVTMVRGRVVRVDQQPVAGVEVSIGKERALTDKNGWFTLFDVPAGHQELYVDGSTANTAGAEYGQFVVGAEVAAGRLNELGYLLHLPRIAARDKIRIPSPTVQDMVVGHPDIPGLQLRIPKGTVVLDRKGRLVTELAIVPTPVNRAPFPVTENHPMAFTVEPGGAQIRGLDPGANNGIQVYYPNYDGYAAGTQANFWMYDPRDGWRVYGKGTVSADGKHFVPEPGVALHQTMGGMYSVPSNDPPSEAGLPPDGHCCGTPGSGGVANAADPIDLKTGEFVHSETDLQIADVTALSLSRSYRPHDLKQREFGIGTASNWGYYLHNPGGTYDSLDLVLPTGAYIRFDRASGSGPRGEWRQAGSTTQYAGAVLQSVYDPDPLQPWGRGFRITLRDGSRMQFSSYMDTRLRWLEDRYGNRTTLLYDAGLVARIVSPSGRYIGLEYDSRNRIAAATDNAGNRWTYAYDSNGLLATVGFPDGGSKAYAYQTRSQNNALAQHRMQSITDARGKRVLLNEFEIVNGVSTGRVIKQTQADGGVFVIDYAHVDGGTTGVLVTSPDGSKRRVVFDGNSAYPKTDILAYGTDKQQTYSFERNAYGQVTASIDPLGRRTEYRYDAGGRPLQVTLLAGTTQARVSSLSYTSDGDLQSATDPLGRVTRLDYGANRCLTAVTDPGGRTARFACDGAGLPLSATNAIGQTIAFQYAGYDLAGMVDPLGRSTRFQYDGLGRLTGSRDDQGNATRQEYDALGRVSKAYDAAGNVTEFGYDKNGNVLAILLPHGNGITYTYDERNRPLTRTDALGQSETWTYDTMDRVASYTDRKGQKKTFTYDVLGRLSVVTEADGRTQTFTYDAGNRRVALVDSAAGTLSWEYDLFDQVIKAITPQGNIVYEYDAAGRRTKMIAANQAALEYRYDTVDRLRILLQGSETVTFDYDAADRLTETTLPNGVKTGYAYNTANETTGIAWLKLDGTALGEIGYGYDQLGRLVAQTGSFAPQALPAARSGSFDDNNRQTQADGQTLSYDANGNLLSDGVRTYVWNARDQLVEIKQGTASIASFGYDPLGRRISKTEGGQTISYLYDGLDAVQETQGGTVNPILTGLGIDERYARNEASGRAYFLSDALGSTRALTNASGSLIQRYDYTPYGQTSQASAGTTNPYQYTGRELDKSGLLYYRARYYNPAIGRFISEDSYGFGGGDANFYAYALGNPISVNDPTGHVAWLVLLPLIWGGIEVGLSLYDLYDTGQTLLDPCASVQTKSISVGMFAAGLFLPGGGYGVGAKKVEQYSLRAAKGGWYPIATRGQKQATGLTWLDKGDVWKFGTTQNPSTRYSKAYLDGVGTGGLRYVPEYTGTKIEALTLERMKIDNFSVQNGILPAGNKIRR